MEGLLLNYVMKKIFVFFYLGFIAFANAQTRLVSFPLELKKPRDNHQILNGINDQNQIFAFASDRDNVTILKFNSAIFFQDSLKINRPDKNFAFMSGYSFSENGNPIVFWASENYKKIKSVEYNLKEKTTFVYDYSIPFTDEEILLTFNENNSFYILSRSKKADQLKLYIFGKDKQERTFDFSEFKFKDGRNKPTSFNKILERSPIEKIDPKIFNSLFYTVKQTKLYIGNDKIFLHFNHNPQQTQVFEIDIATSEITEKIFLQPILKEGRSNSNSFFHNNKLYQLNLNDKEMAFTINSYPSGQLLKAFNVTANDSIAFKNSPLLIQTGNKEPRDLKTTKKFLRRLSSSDVGLSVYQTAQGNLITIGRSKNVSPTGNMLLGVTLGISAAVSGNSNIFIGDVFENETAQSIYFESLLDTNFVPVKSKTDPLAVDYIAGFLDKNGNAVLATTLKYNDFYILCYYDSDKREFVMRKFQDGFD